MTIHTTGAVPDLFSEEVGSDPFSAYAELRALGPVYDEQNDLWLLTRHADVIHALHEPRIFSSAGGYSEFMSGRAGPDARLSADSQFIAISIALDFLFR